MKHQLCSAIKPDGTPCRKFTLARHRCCRYHKNLDQRARRRLRALRPPAIRLGPLADRRSIQRALYRVIQAIAAGSLPPKQSAALLERIRAASDSLPR